MNSDNHKGGEDMCACGGNGSCSRTKGDMKDGAKDQKNCACEGECACEEEVMMMRGGCCGGGCCKSN